MTSPIGGLLVDMNGLWRHWHNTGAQKTEHHAGLPSGTIARYAYDHPTYRAARVGLLTDQQWADDVADRLAADHGPDVRPALTHWRADRGEADPTMLALLPQIRRHLPVGVLSNCTDALPTDLEHHGITFDYVFSSASLGVDKPSLLAFTTATDRMGLNPEEVGYFDDEPTFVHAARTAGLRAHLFRDPSGFIRDLNQLGVTVALP